jgi:hypothetical protein
MAFCPAWKSQKFFPPFCNRGFIRLLKWEIRATNELLLGQEREPRSKLDVFE